MSRWVVRCRGCSAHIPCAYIYRRASLQAAKRPLDEVVCPDCGAAGKYSSQDLELVNGEQGAQDARGVRQE